MKTVMLHVSDDPGMEVRFQAALALTRQQEGHLTCLQVTPVPYIPMEAGASRSTVELLFEGVEGPARVQREALETRLSNELVSWDWRRSQGTDVLEIERQAMLGDVIVVGTGEEGPDISVAGGLAVHCSVPVLAVPGTARRFEPAGPAMIAWNGSHEAANAVRRGLPLLRAAASVHVVSLAEKPLELGCVDVATYLSRHEIHAEVIERHDGQDIADGLNAAALELGASSIVMGGYGHSRMQERVFGGVTRAMLQHGRVPMLLSH